MTSTVSESQQASGASLVVPQTMRAVSYERYGDPTCLQLAEVKTPKRLPGSVVIRIHAAGVNPIDARLRRGEVKWLLPGGFPRIPGYDVAGTVVDAADDLDLRKGDRVLSFLDSLYGGGYAEYAKCSASFVVKIPDSMTYEEAAALPLAGSTALQGLQDKGNIKRGDRVLINGASGGVGALAVQIATAHGAEVTGVASGKHQDFVREMGAHDLIDYQQQDFAKLGRTWDLIFDAAGLRSYLQVRHALKRGGRYVTTEPGVTSAAMTLLTKLSSRHGCMMLVRPNGGDLSELVRLYNAGQLRVTLADALPITRAAEAHRRLEAGGHCGKYVLRVVDAN